MANSPVCCPAALSGAGSDSLTYAWTAADPTGTTIATLTGDDSNFSFTPAGSGTYTVTR